MAPKKKKQDRHKPDPKDLDPHTLDPHHLIALMHYTYYEAQDGSPRRLGLTSLNLKNGFSDEPKTNLQTCFLLDALASICVSKPGSQVVAIALRVSSQEHKINLTIAENDNVSRKLEVHLQSVWRKLQDLSHMYKAGREEGSSKEATQRVTFPLRVAMPYFRRSTTTR